MAWEVQVHQLDVGQGESALLLAIERGATGAVSQVRSVLVDGGLEKYGRDVHRYVVDCLAHWGSSQLNAIVVSHYDGDHYEGLTALLELDHAVFQNTLIFDCGQPDLAKYFPPRDPRSPRRRAVFLAKYRKYLKVIAQSPTRIRVTANVGVAGGNPLDWLVGEELLWCAYDAATNKVVKLPVPAGAPVLGCVAANASVLLPGNRKLSYYERSRDRNDFSIGLLLQFNNFRFYTAGDLPSWLEDELVPMLTNSRMERLHAFKAGHHGSNGSSSQNFLDAVQPVVALVSCGERQPYGHPAQGAINRLQMARSIQNFYMTACPLKSTYIADPESGETQLFLKARVCGAAAGLRPGLPAQPGTVVLMVSDGQSRLYNSRMKFVVRYFESDLAAWNEINQCASVVRDLLPMSAVGV